MLEKHGDIKFVKNVLIYLLYIIIIPIIIYDMILIIQTIIKPETTPNLFGIKTFSIVSGSMNPIIEIDDIVIVKNVDIYDLKKGDIVTYKLQNETVTHRIIDIENVNNKLIFTTKGDNNEVTDIEKIEYNQIEGRYIGKIPKIGKALYILKNKYVFGAIIIILIICYLVQRKHIAKREERKQKREKFERKKRLL